MTNPLFPSDLDPRDAEIARLKRNISTLLGNIATAAFCGSDGNGCGAEIWWIKTRLGKSAPVNADGASHFGTCPFARNFKKGVSA